MPGEGYFPDCVVLAVKFGGANVVVYGFFFWFGLEPLVLVNGNINSEVYVNILGNIDISMLPTLWQRFTIGPFIYQYDNVPVHKAKAIAS